jgi:hypothetical protein
MTSFERKAIVFGAVLGLVGIFGMNDGTFLNNFINTYAKNDSFAVTRAVGGYVSLFAEVGQYTLIAIALGALVSAMNAPIPKDYFSSVVTQVAGRDDLLTPVAEALMSQVLCVPDQSQKRSAGLAGAIFRRHSGCQKSCEYPSSGRLPK